jgi:hypothetical protein
MFWPSKKKVYLMRVGTHKRMRDREAMKEFGSEAYGEPEKYCR